MTLEFKCANVGVTDCKAATRAATAEELVAKVAEHARTVHGVELNDTLVSYALTTVKEV